MPVHLPNFCALAALALSASVAAAASTASPVAYVFGKALECRDVGGDEPSGCATGLLRHVRTKVGEAFIAQNRLNATAVELERLSEYNRAFERHDRSQRARKLAEIEERLANGALTAAERARLDEFRAILLRLAHYEADVDAGIETREPTDENTLRSWIEAAKLNAALFARFGGIIGVAPSGPYAHGAMRTLILEHVRRGDVRILDAAIESEFAAALERPPRFVHTGGAPDFTPFWERPISPSYMPD